MAETVTLARNAMATRFEIVLYGENPVFLRAAGEEALDEIERIEAQLSLYRPTSEIAHVNARAAQEPVRVTPAVFALLKQAAQISRETEGAFDPSVGPVLRCWGFMNGKGREPSKVELEAARQCVGMRWIDFDECEFTVRFKREGMLLDLGAIGKGYAIDCAVALLREAGVNRALLHGGTSTAFALGSPPDAPEWTLAISGLPSPPPQAPATEGRIYHNPPAGGRDPMAGNSAHLLPVVRLRDDALSVSAVWGRFFEQDGRTFGHVIDPRTGRPVTHTALAAVALPSATESDALSTALLTGGKAELARLAALRQGLRALVVTECAAGLSVETAGFSALDAAQESRDARMQNPV